MPWMAAAAIAAPIVAGLIANAKAKKDRQAQKDSMKDAMKALEAAGMPPDLSMPMILQEFQRAGAYTPEMEQDLNDTVAESAFKSIDPALKDTQMSALQMLKQRGKVGLSAEDRASLNQVRSEVQRDSEAKRQQILQQMQARGMGGSGAEMMTQLQSAQGAADQASSASDSLMSQAQQRALQALTESGNMAGNIRGQEFQQASALDERNRFLAENSISRQQRNVGALNEAQRMNLSEQQRIADANTAMKNAELERQNREKGTQWDRKLAQAGGKAAQYGRQADFQGQQAAATAAGIQGIGNAVGTGVAAYGQNQTANAASAQSQANIDRQYKLDLLKAQKG